MKKELIRINFKVNHRSLHIAFICSFSLKTKRITSSQLAITSSIFGFKSNRSFLFKFTTKFRCFSLFWHKTDQRFVVVQITIVVIIAITMIVSLIVIIIVVTLIVLKSEWVVITLQRCVCTSVHAKTYQVNWCNRWFRSVNAYASHLRSLM